MSKRRTGDRQQAAAATAGISVSSGRRIERGDLQTRAASPRGWRRPDPFKPVWKALLLPLLERHPSLTPTTLLEHPQEQRPAQDWTPHLRTLQRLWQPAVPTGASDPPCLQRQCHAWRHLGITVGGDGSPPVVFQAKGLQRQHLLRVPVPNGQIPARQSRPAIRQQRRGMRVGSGVCRLVQPPAPPSGIKFVPPHQRHSGAAKDICQQRVEVYEKARRANPTCWGRNTRCWHQTEEVWINKPPEEPKPIQALSLIQAA